MVADDQKNENDLSSDDENDVSHNNSNKIVLFVNKINFCVSCHNYFQITTMIQKLFHQVLVIIILSGMMFLLWL